MLQQIEHSNHLEFRLTCEIIQMSSECFDCKSICEFNSSWIQLYTQWQSPKSSEAIKQKSSAETNVQYFCALKFHK